MAEPFQLAAHVKVMHTLEHKGFEAYLAGGAVRDRIIRRASKDFDITTDALPEQVQAIFSKTVPVGAKFGVVVVVMDGVQVEVATYRADGKYTDGRRPDTVQYSKTAKEDVVRRDFTMNGLLMDSNGDIKDFVGGREDIEKRLIRCIGDPNVRFAEDALRMLRAVRFAATLGFKIEEKTFEAIKQNARLIRVISSERVSAELFKIFSSPEPLKGLVPFISTGLYRFCLPEDFADHANMTLMIQRFGTFTANKDPMLGMAMFFADCAEHVAAGHTALDDLTRLTKFMKFSNEQAQALVYMKSLVLTFRKHLTTRRLTEAELKRTCRQAGLEFALEIMTQDELMGKTAIGIEGIMDFVLKVRAYTADDLRPAPLATGQDLIDLGLTPGPLFTEVLFEIETAQLNGTMTDRATVLAKLKERVWRDDRGELTHELRGLDRV